MRRLPSACLAILLAAATTGAMAEFPQQMLLPLEAAADDAGAAAALVTLPAGWSAGDAVAIILADAPQAGLRDALLGEQAAVVELALPGHGCGSARRLRDVARAARRDLGAGLLVAIGVGCAGDAALRAAEAAEAPFAAAVALREGRVDVARGVAPAASEQWGLRAPAFCALLAATAGGGTTMATCLARLSPPRS